MLTLGLSKGSSVKAAKQILLGVSICSWKWQFSKQTKYLSWSDFIPDLNSNKIIPNGVNHKLIKYRFRIINLRVKFDIYQNIKYHN